MDPLAIRTVQLRSLRCTKEQATAELTKHLDLISNKYPEGLPSDTYFVIPGFEHVTKNQPIIKFNPAEGVWEVKSINKFELTKNK
jgi:hypothetical protein